MATSKNALAPQPANSLAYGPRNLMGTQMLRGPDEAYLRQQFPGLYGALGGLLATAPDVMEGSVLDPNTAAVRQGAEYTFPIGTALAMLPGVGPSQKVAMTVGRVGERFAERAVPQIMERGGLPAQLLGDLSQGSRSQIFVGENSKTWNKVNAAKAVELEKAGVAPEDIWAATGTFRGPEGKLRQEISDANSMPGQKLYSWGENKDLEQGNSTVVRRQKALLHPELSAAYPDTKNIGVFLKPWRAGGYYEAQLDNIGVPVIGKNNAADRSLMLHELQHAIQAREGFATGGNVQEFKSGPMFNPIAKDLNADLSKALTGGYSARPEEIIESIKYGDPKEFGSIVNKYGFKNVDDALEFLKNEDIKRTPFGQYQRLAGEAEARATQTRMNMTPQERLSTFPYQSYDVPVNQLIVRTK